MREAGEDGFTLIEMLVALAILAMALGTIFAVFSQDMARQQADRDAMRARVIAETLLTQARTSAAAPAPSDGGTTADGFHWQVTAAPYGGDDDRVSWRFVPVEIHSTVQWDESGHTRRLTLATLRPAVQDTAP